MTNFETTLKQFSCGSVDYAQGDLLKMAENGKFDIIVQGCNCFNTMGGGLAKTIREKFPNVAEVDNLTEKGDYNKLGNYTLAWSNVYTGFIIVNAYTQYNMSTGKDVFEYTAFSLILQKLAKQFRGENYGFPLIGMGLAHGKPAIIIEMICEFADEIRASGGSVTIVEFI